MPSALVLGFGLGLILVLLLPLRLLCMRLVTAAKCKSNTKHNPKIHHPLPQLILSILCVSNVAFSEGISREGF